MATTYLNRSVTGNNNSVGKWTFSCWVKRTELGNTTHLFNFYTDTNNRGGLRFNSDDTILYYESVSGTSAVNINTNAVFRDTSAWYHIVLEVDKTISTPDTKIYVNGTSQTFQTDSDYTQNESTIVNSNTNLYINSEDGSNNIRNQILTHVHWIDGTAYDASYFGETDATTGIWKPKTAPSVTYGTNGFFLKFENSGSMGTDSSGNGNNFTVNGTLTQTVDTPSNVFATFNPLNVPTSNAPTYSNGNNTVVTANGTSAYFGGTSSLGVSSGKWYTEFKVSDVTADAFIGITFDPAEDARNNRYTGQSSSSWGYYSGDGNYRTNGSATSYGATFTTGDIIGIAMDLDNAKLYFSKNGTFQNSGDPTSGATGTGAISITSGETYFFSCGDGTASSASTIQANFGNGYFGTTAVSSATSDESGLGIFEYSVPSGYYCLCTKNINLLEYA